MSSDTMKATHHHRMDQARTKRDSGLASVSNKVTVTKDDFLDYFMGKEAGGGISTLEITSRCPNEPNTSVKHEDKLCEENDSRKLSSQPTSSSYKELHPDNSANMAKMSSDDASKDDVHNRTWTPSPTPSRKRKGDTPVRCSMRLRSRKEEVVLLDGDTPHQKSDDETSNKRDSKTLYYPSREHPNPIEISPDDIKCLQPESLLSSPIMNFYIMYLQGPMSSITRPRSAYHIFNTYFYSKLEALTSKEDKTTYFLKLRRWWKGVDIFQKAYILLPVHAETHWSLVIVCMPAKGDQRGPIILHLDSLKFHSSRMIFSVVSRILKEEWNYLNENDAQFPLHETVWRNLPRKIEKKQIEVPQQGNDYDCGVFVLYYMQRFIQEAPERLHKKDLSMFGKGWFRPEEPSRLRLEIRRLLRSGREAESMNETTELSCGEAEPNSDAELSCAEAESKRGAAEQSCGDDKSRNDATVPMAEEVGVAATTVSASDEENCKVIESNDGPTEPLCGGNESKNDTTELTTEHLSAKVAATTVSAPVEEDCKVIESNDDATTVSVPVEEDCKVIESNNDATEPPCGEAELKNDAVEPTTPEQLAEEIEGAATDVSALVEET